MGRSDGAILVCSVKVPSVSLFEQSGHYTVVVSIFSAALYSIIHATTCLIDEQG